MISSLSLALILFSFSFWRFCFVVVLSERISGSAGDVLDDDPVGRLKVFVYDLPYKYNKKALQKDPRCLSHMFAAEIFMHRFLLSSPVRTSNPEEADWFYTPVYVTCDLTPNGLPLPFKSPRMMRSAVQLISSKWPYWNRTEGADHFFVVPHDFGACFHYQEEKAIERGILPLLQKTTLVQTFGQRNHVCLNDGSITIPPYAPPEKMKTHLISPATPRSIFVYFRGLFYDINNDPEGGYYARGARAAVWENFKNNPLFDISADHPTTYYEDMQRAVFCLCPLGWAPWSPRLVEGVIFGCIPVIIADDIVLPFADAIPWEDIAVFVAEEDVPKLDTILTSIPPEVVLRKQRLLANPSMKRAMLFPQPTRSGDAFHQILNGLARKLPHSRSIYLGRGQMTLNWTAGPAGDLKPCAQCSKTDGTGSLAQKTVLHDLYEQQGQSPWYDNLCRPVTDLLPLIAKGVRGVTSNPAIFQKAISTSDAYNEQFRELIKAGRDTESAYWELVVKDIQDACRLFESIYDETDGGDGYVSVEVSPRLAGDADGTVEAAKWLHRVVNRRNVYIKIPATAACVPSIKNTISFGISVNVTLIFSLSRYAEVIDAYLDGLEASRLSDLSKVTSVASFFVSRVDTLVDKKLADIGTADALDLRGKAAVAQAGLAYKLYQKKFSGPRWESLVKRGAKKQRLLWASTGVKNPAYPDTLYIGPLIGPDTVSTMPDQALEAFVDHGEVGRTIDGNISEAEGVYNAIEKMGIGWEGVGERLEEEGVLSFVNSFDNLLDTLEEKAILLKQQPVV